MVLLQWSEWPEPQAAGERGVWQSCDIMTSSDSCGWKVCLHPPSQQRHGKGESQRERENWQASVSMWGAGKGGEVARERMWQSEGEGLIERNWKARGCLCEREGGCAKEREWRPLSTWHHQTRTEETIAYAAKFSHRRTRVSHCNLMYCKSRHSNAKIVLIL